jgi:hypothetical protein
MVVFVDQKPWLVSDHEIGSPRIFCVIELALSGWRPSNENLLVIVWLAQLAKSASAAALHKAHIKIGISTCRN